MLVALSFSTTTLTVAPGVPGGNVQVRIVSDKTVTVEDSVSPTRTTVTPAVVLAKPSPMMVRTVPPTEVPETGDTESTPRLSR